MFVQASIAVAWMAQVHHQERHLINCITHWYVRAGESSCSVNVWRTSYKFTPQICGLLEKPTVLSQFRIFPQSTWLNPICLRSIWMLSSYIGLFHSDGLIPSCFVTKILYEFSCFIYTWCVQVLRSPKEAFAAAMQSWRERCEKCVCLQGDYVEKWLHFQLPVVSSFFFK